MIIGYIKEDFKTCKSSEKIKELKDFGCTKVFEEKQSIENLNKQTVYRELKSNLCSGDVLVVHDMICLGRNKQEIKKEWETFIKEKIDVVILKNPVIDTRRFNEIDSGEQYISKIVFSLLSWVVDEERSRIRFA